MTGNEEIGGSPPCLACEMGEAYAGFLPPAELAAEITALLGLVEQARNPAQWRAVLEAALQRRPPPSGTGTASSDLVAATRALLPRIADDRLHAALKALVRS